MVCGGALVWFGLVWFVAAFGCGLVGLSLSLSLGLVPFITIPARWVPKIP